MTITRDFITNADAAPMVPVSLTANWMPAITSTLGTADGAPVTNPNTFTDDNHVNLMRGSKRGTAVRARMAYPAAMTVTTPPAIKLFGRSGTDAWQILENRDGARTAALAVAADDASDGTLKYTHPSPTAHSWDCDGCDEVKAFVETALAGSGGTIALASVELKII